MTTKMVLYNQWNMTSLLTIEYSFVRSLRERIFNYSCSVFISPLIYIYIACAKLILASEHIYCIPMNSPDTAVSTSRTHV